MTVVTRQDVANWLTAHGLNPGDVRDVVIGTGPDGPRLEATLYDRNEAGNRYLPRGCVGYAKPGVDHLDCQAVTYWVAVPLQYMPGAEPQ